MADGSTVNPSFVPEAGTIRAFRAALGCFATGVTLVTTQGLSGPVGFVANSFSSLSLEPPLVLWSPARASSRFELFAKARHYSIHVLAVSQRDLVPRFLRGGEGFAGLAHRRNAQGTPVLTQAVARFDCEQHATHEGGDHLIVVGRVVLAVLNAGAPLVFAAGQYGGFTAAA